MSDIKLFRYDAKGAQELAGVSALVERQLQRLIEAQMETFLGVRFLASEYSTGKTHKGRIDSLGLDENGCPVIIEYKRHTNENVMTQGLFYLDWLMDHRGDFTLLVHQSLGADAEVDWTAPRLVCAAATPFLCPSSSQSRKEAVRLSKAAAWSPRSQWAMPTLLYAAASPSR